MAARTASWVEVADRLAATRSYWLGTCDPGGRPHAVPVWGAVLRSDLYMFSERRTAKARHLAGTMGRTLSTPCATRADLSGEV
ncbi:pyridoxamine 5'-phosphate oxidase family protein [Nocardioides sp. GXQ0305]|uniref:pyridoxamine 5'-phosphate oxidase family protein n=1 Tax=Nocardioides sp. GXQ0305 TaxID=3423912 RepID=UPI003D7EED1C